MGRIQSSIGLITGVPIADTVDQLMALAARPHDMLKTRNDTVVQQQAAITALSALLYALKFSADQLGKKSLFEELKATSSNPDALSATLTGDAVKGSYRLTPLRTAQSQQLVSSGFLSNSEPLGGGALTFRFGPHAQRSTPAELLNGGQGIVGGWIRITDRSGARADIDLTLARTVDDVLEAISGSTAINVTAVAHGDGIRLVDNTGQTVSNLIVQEVAGGTTAASLGLDGIDVAAAVADGRDIVRLYDDLDLDALHDGSGVSVNTAMPDVGFTLRDGTTGSIDFSRIIPGGSQLERQSTLGQMIEVINAAAPGKLQAEIGPDGDRLVLRDLTEGEAAFEVHALYDSRALADLGLDGAAQDGVITGTRLMGGTQSVLLSSLNGGRGFGSLGSVELRDRSGASDTVDLSAAQTLEEAVELLNSAAVGIRFGVNQARNGIELVDTTGSQAAGLLVASGDATGTAEKLGIAVDAEVTQHNGGDLHLQVVSESTLLSAMNGGRGVARGTLTIEDSAGGRSVLDLRDEKIQTVGDAIKAINRLGIDVYAEINETGDGIRIRDTAGGSGTLRVSEGQSTTACDLGLLRTAQTVTIEGQSMQAVDGSLTYRVELDAADTLDDLREKINELGAGVAASTFTDGSGRPYRLALTSQQAGRAGTLVVDTSAAGFDLQEITRAQDALLALGDASAGAGLLVSSSSNRFTGVVEGLSLELKQATGTPVTVTVSQTDTKLVAALKSLVDNYNKFRDKLSELTKYDVDQDKRSLLTGDSTALRLDADFAELLTGRFFGNDKIQSLAAVGISFQQDGTLEFDAAKFDDVYAENPQAVEQFFTAEQTGLAARLGQLVEQTAGDNSLISKRLEALDDKIADNRKTLEQMEKQLDSQRERLLLEFYRMELAVAKLQNNLSFLDSIQKMVYTPSTKG